MDSWGAKRTSEEGVPPLLDSAKVFIRREMAWYLLCKVLHRNSLLVKCSF